MDYEKGKESLVNLRNWYNQGNINSQRNEADTRFRLIDQIFFDCLGWEKTSCKMEENLKGESADYTFHNPNRCFIVEAKREGIYFELPAGWDRLEYKISSLSKENQKIFEAIKQAIDYCQARGVLFGAVSNGYQIIAFLASRNDGIPPLEGKALVFDSLDSMEANFLSLWQTLSKDGISEKRLLAKLSDNSIILLPPKLSTQISSYPGYKIRNTIQTDLQIVGEVVLEDVIKNQEIEEEFIKQTYCSSGALSQYALVSKTILEQRYALLYENNDGPIAKPASNRKGVDEEIFAESLSSRPILLIGDVGSGKTMFIKYLRSVEAHEIFKKSFTLYIDLGSKAALDSNIKEFITNEIYQLLLQDYNIDLEERNFVRGVYNGDLIRFSKGIYGDLKKDNPAEFINKEIEFLSAKLNNKAEHLKACFISITKSWKKQIVIFIDNVDQREIEIQEEAFLIANEISQNWPSTVFLTIRPTTFYKSKKDGALSGYHPKAFTIAPPRVDDVLMKRIHFAINITNGNISLSKFNNSLGVNLSTLKQFLEILNYSFENNSELKEFIDNICYGNIRLAIEYLTTFIGSGHIDTSKILDYDNEHTSSKDGKRYQIALHEFIRSIIYKDHSYFYPESTSIVNMFEISQSDPKEHFLLPFLLDYFIRYSSMAQSEGFVETKHVIDFLQNIGYNYSQIEFGLFKSISKNLIESEGRTSFNFGDKLPLYLRITSIGAYHVKKLIFEFTYLDAIIVDCPILDKESRAVIINVWDIHDRLIRADFFIDYLTKQWNNIPTNIKGFDWRLIADRLKLDITKVKTKLVKNIN